MSDRSQVGFEVDLGAKPVVAAAGEPKPFRIAVFGDFSGRRQRGAPCPVRDARAMAIDRDSVDRVLARIAPALELEFASGRPRVPISFASLDDFHPDALYRRLPLFGRLRDLRREVSDPRTARELLGAPRASAATAPMPRTAGRSLLDQILDQPEGGAPVVLPPPGADLQPFLDRIVAGSLVPGKTAEQEGLVARVDAAISEEMRAILHHPEFQALEAAWRGIHFLTRRLETGVGLQVALFDVAKEDLAEDLNETDDLSDTGFYRKLLTEVASSQPWALVLGNYTFGPDADDVELLARIGMVAARAHAPFLAAAAPSAIGCNVLEGTPEPRDWRVDSDASSFWQTLRELPEAPYLGLLMPRYLVRLPYGAETDAAEELPFEEMPGLPVHGNYLWGNPVFLAGCLLGETFSAYGWEMRPGSVREMDRMPLHVYKIDGEPVAQPCAEAWMTDHAGAAILERGIMPVLSARDGDRVLLLRFQSVANPAAPLSGRW